VAATSATNAWAVGVVGTGRSLILHWNGKKWSTVSAPDVSNSDPGAALGREVVEGGQGPEPWFGRLPERRDRDLGQQLPTIGSRRWHVTSLGR
jgi:hypothetical protein